mmetsp:Transcript_2439/g.4443  ORF Transcript_2439/g.4443 Transcript_2439/m.4443 type:complete len:355 (+) Transcript_2439:131-1195(+)|eukprot:CAMPEP_0114435576 /NCGR_PEP_ID=MMETSP0103-20121206/12918_1 /TAXON_ID=37642 ORGANISM="Paraphysomonas imperforata, Strain PA2" /NCGR_SAMPLE_ID=MMETSP0103 /ASSEMBLY_ACC=CAM_ASM_000201 /LENGTH=354 /DNA_ID=CAMNT_0001605639 /DNA_START=81 /DNA_END=1145 /DNA_ORIENTATION=-
MSKCNHSRILWGIIGCGDVTEVKSAPKCFKSDTSDVLLCMRRDKEKAKDYALRHSISFSCSTMEEFFALCGQHDINSVYIATPPSSHKDFVIDAVSMGYNVYIEKPIALNSVEACAIQECLQQHPDSKLTVAHYRRELELFQHVKTLLLDEKNIGQVRSCSLRCWKYTEVEDYSDPDNWRLNPSISGGGYFHDLAPHQLDILIYLFGYPLFNQGMSASPSQGQGVNHTPPLANDHVNGLSLFPNNVIFNGSWCFAVPKQYAVDECIIIGTTGSIKFSFFGSSGVVCMVTNSITDQPRTKEWSFEHPKHIQKPMIDQVNRYFDSTSSGEKTNPCSIQDAVVVMEMMDAYTSLPSA